jgi:hypothetical protein
MVNVLQFTTYVQLFDPMVLKWSCMVHHLGDLCTLEISLSVLI